MKLNKKKNFLMVFSCFVKMKWNIKQKNSENQEEKIGIKKIIVK